MIEIDLSKGWTRPFERWSMDCENPWWLTLTTAIATFMICGYFVS